MTARPSRTARAIAMGRAIGLRGLYDPLVPRALASRERRLVETLRRGVEASSAGELAVNALTAGLAAHGALRMSAVDAAVEDAVNDGAGQLVVVGAGFDTRAWRLEVVGGLRLVEVDLPAIQAHKVRAFLDLEPLADLSYVSADLATTDLGDALDDSGHASDIPTTWVWEAVTPYLPRDAVRATLTSIGRLSAPGSHLVVTFASPDLIGSGAVSAALSPVARGLFAGLGEPLRSTWEDDEFADLLEDDGWSCRPVTGPTEWGRAAGRTMPLSLFGAERLAHATR